MINRLLLLALLVLPLSMLAGEPACADTLAPSRTEAQRQLIFADDFPGRLDPGAWVAEIAPEPHSSVSVQDGRLVLDTRGGVTVWLNRKLQGNLLIEFRRKVLVADGPNDRLSDLNLFWMASDPKNAELFTRDGRFESYDGLDLYYVGMGGNHNTSTRFRKYGGGERRLLQEYTDAAHLLKPNHEYLIQVLVRDGRSSVFVDGQTYFTFDDPAPLRSGYFGLRSTWSRQQVRAVRVWQLP